jgi:hypothetical protein
VPRFVWLRYKCPHGHPDIEHLSQLRLAHLTCLPTTRCSFAILSLIISPCLFQRPRPCALAATPI